MEEDRTARFHDQMDAKSLTLIGTPVLQDVVDASTGQTHKRERAEFVPVWKQTVTDSEGRKRFHGAFTGGFSAGYFNTVGSKEGWTPSSFVSSRDARATTKLTVDDFMDDEDREAGLATTLSAKGGYGLFSDQVASASTKEHASVERAMEAMLAPAPDNVGLALMRRMGWSDGQGIGPLRGIAPTRVRGAQDDRGSKEPKKRAVGFGPALSRDEIEEIRSAPAAPRDVGVVRYQTKDDSRGLGYSPMSMAPLSGGSAAPRKKSKDAFGLGALELEDAEDDIYAVDHAEQYESGRFSKRERSEGGALQNPRGAGRNCTDGRPPLERFVLASSPSAGTLLANLPFPNVQVPPSWKPSGAPSVSSMSAAPPPAVVQWAISAAQRGMAMMEAAHKRKALESRPAPPIKVEAPAVAPSSSSFGPRKPTALPFHGNPAKQQRYQNWLLAENGLSSVWKDVEQPSLEEMIEFAKVKSEWSAVPQGMSDRFAAAGTMPVVDGDQVPKMELVAQEFRKYGPGTTRTEVDWAPEPLLCKRWNVKDPFADSARLRPSTNNSKDERLEAFPSLTRELEKQFGAAYRVQMEQAAEEARKAADAHRAAVVEAATVLAEDAPRPGAEVFRAIFDTPIIMPPAATYDEGLVAVPPWQPPGPVSSLPAVPHGQPAGAPSSSSSDQSLFTSIFGDFPAASAEPAVKRTRTQELLEKSVVLSDWLQSEKKKEKKKKKEKEKKKKKKDKKKK